MAPPTAIGHAEQAADLTPRPVTGELAASAVSHLLNRRTWGQLRLILDVAVLYLASVVALFAAPVSAGAATRWLAALFPVVALGALHGRPNPDDRLHAGVLDTLGHVLGAVSLATVVTIALGSITGGHPVQLTLRLWLFAAVYLGVARVVLLSVRRHAITNEAFAIPTLIVGAGTVGAHLVKRLTSDRRYGLRPVGFLDANPPQTGTSSLPVLGGPHKLSDAVRTTGAGHVILAFSTEPDHLLVETVKECERLGVGVSLVPRLFESISAHAVLDHVGALPLLSLRFTDPRGWQFAVKHALDRAFALAGLVALAPVMFALAIAVRLSSPGPVFFRQQRVGRDGREFTMLKFRTMRGDPAADGEADAGWAARIRGEARPEATVAEDRTTTVGKWLRDTSLDEVPQLINVLRGDMSLVGPRPERVGYARDFERLVRRYTDRHRVKSGITGWAQVNGLRGETSIHDRVEWDNYYIQNWSLRLDLRIMMLTLAELLRTRDSADSRPANYATVDEPAPEAREASA